jgi:hypothetical protein
MSHSLVLVQALCGSERILDLCAATPMQVA